MATPSSHALQIVTAQVQAHQKYAALRSDLVDFATGRCVTIDLFDPNISK
jgi:hypothetical protein